MTRTIPLLTAAVLSVSLTGCARTRIADGLDTNYAPTDGDHSVAFWHKLPERKTVTNNEGLHGLIEFALGEDPSTNWDDRLALAREKGLLAPSATPVADESMTRGTLAAGLAKAMNLKGGTMMKILPHSPRYATRELVYRGVLPEGSTEYQSISGLDYVGVIGKAQDVMSLDQRGRMK